MKGGNDVLEIEMICGLSKTDFFQTVYCIEKIKDRKNEVGFKSFMGSVLTKISVLNGIKGEIDAFTKQDIIKMLTTTYYEFSVEEVYKAFELERYGVYETRTDHFQLFNTEYISEVLKKYKKWKVKEKQLLNIEAPKQTKEVTEEEKKQIREGFLMMAYESMRDEKFYSSAWLFWEDEKKDLTSLAKKIDALISTPVKKRLYRIQNKKYLIELENDVNANGKRPHQIELLERAQKNSSEGKSNVIVKNRCRAIVVCNYLKKHLEDFETFKKAIE